MLQSLHIVPVHIVFSTRRREPFLTDAVRERVCAYMGKCLQNLKCTQVTVGGVEDHVHILCNFTKHEPAISVMQKLKQDSSKFVKTLGQECAGFSWQDGYGMFGVSPSHIAAVRRYVLDQEAHHKTESFEDEYRRLLVKYGAEYDERYIWD